MASVQSKPQPNTDPQAARRILVAEDNPVTKDLLKLLLTQRGHAVDIVDDGAAALKALQEHEYDVVLMDFHLPKMDGLEVASTFRSGDSGKKLPRFVAMTSDMKGLLGHAANCETFDGVMAKPFDLQDVCRAIEGDLDAAVEPDKPAAVASGPKPARKPRKRKSEPASARFSRQLQDLDYEFLRWPDDFNARRLSARGFQASLGAGAFDAILVTERATVSDLAQIWSNKGLHGLPVIDLTGALGHRADLDASKLSYGETDEVDRLVRGFHERRGQIHRDLLLSDELGDMLLNRILLSGEGLKPAYDPSSPGLVCFNAVLDAEVAEKEAAKLFKGDFLDRTLFDRFQHCDRCGSSRFNVREECSSCRSPDVTEEAYLHHFRCAYQGLESDFRQGDDLVCPKCRHELSHFSVDYDKPGAVLKCADCGHATSEPAIGLLCLDCESHYDGDGVKTRDVFSYDLSERGRAYLEAGRAFLGSKRQALRFAELPIELIVALNAELKKFEDDKIPFALVNIAYQNERAIAHEEGPRQFNTARDLFLENLTNALRKQDSVVKGHGYDFALMRGSTPEEARAGLEDIRTQASETLRVDLGIVMHAYGAEEFA